MRDPSPRAPFDQGLFLTHFNKGKEFYDQKQFEDSERQLEEAYLLRPRDLKVLNLLGLVYFRQEKFEKAEEVYRKLVAESPEAHTLYYNLGLICFKLSRLEEAESAFIKALAISQGNPKINFYLGSIYERLHRYQDAIYQYRQAGANIMVRRVEDKIAASPSPAAAASPASTLFPLAAEAPKKRPEDTNEFKARDLREKTVPPVPADPPLVAGKTLQPVSEVLLAAGAPARGTSETQRLRVGDGHTLPPGARPPGVASAPSVPSPAPVTPTQITTPAAAPRHETFRFLENNLIEVNFTGKVFIKQGTIYSYSGNLTFWVKEKRPGGHPALVIITGTGKLILTDKEREITLMHVDETVYVEPTHILACEETLTPRYVPLKEGSPTPVEFLALEGRGVVALSAASKPLSLAVTPDLPVSVPAGSVISWSGALTPHLVDDRQLYEVMLPARGSALIRLEGTGRLLVEQAL